MMTVITNYNDSVPGNVADNHNVVDNDRVEVLMVAVLKKKKIICNSCFVQFRTLLKYDIQADVHVKLFGFDDDVDDDDNNNSDDDTDVQMH